jgi:peptidoglycan hydrolase-like protein with peptidoglycan-binding domain
MEENMVEPTKEVYELQYMLRKIAQITGVIPPVNTDGIYGADTREAVRALQAQSGLSPTGEVDKATWDRIFEIYKESVYSAAQGEPIYAFPSPSYTSRAGERSDVITLIQLILSALSVIYDDFEDIEITGVNDEKTVAALKRFQSYHGLPETGALDKRTWDAAARSFNAYYNNPYYSS